MIAVQTNYPRQILAFWKANIIKIIGQKKEYLLLINNLSLTFEQSPDKQISLLKLNKSLCFSCCWDKSTCRAGWDQLQINLRQHLKTSNKSEKFWRRTCEEKSWTGLTSEKSAEHLSGGRSIHQTVVMKTTLSNSVFPKLFKLADHKKLKKNLADH